MKSLILLLFIIQCATSVFCQYKHEDVFPNLEGENLNEQIIETYKPEVVLNYGQARDTLYAIIDNSNDTVSCIYTNHQIYLPKGEDPSNFLLMGGKPNGINAEHVYPQSKGARYGNGKSDMHHLFPARVGANSARGAKPFGEIPDDLTSRWFYKSIEKTYKPEEELIDLFSEEATNMWEPRESKKGDVARAVFYFYTMYNGEAKSADPSFFPAMKDVLCTWHSLDPVDQKEWERNEMIAKWQGSKNPFILDCTLGFRMYCGDDISPACLTVDLEESVTKKIIGITMLTNPVEAFAKFHISDNVKPIDYTLASVTGSFKLQKMIYLNTNSSVLEIPTSDLLPGAYICLVRVKNSSTGRITAVPFKLMKIGR